MVNVEYLVMPKLWYPAAEFCNERQNCSNFEQLKNEPNTLKQADAFGELLPKILCSLVNFAMEFHFETLQG